jgi:hypothetical protein
MTVRLRSGRAPRGPVHRLPGYLSLLQGTALFGGVGVGRRKAENPWRWLGRRRAWPCPYCQQGEEKHRDQEQSKVFLWQHREIPDANIVPREVEALHGRRKPARTADGRAGRLLHLPSPCMCAHSRSPLINRLSAKRGRGCKRLGNLFEVHESEVIQNATFQAVKVQDSDGPPQGFT